jgi:RNase P/RNase MRP subunit p30/RNase P/RNase MRP subunit POP5
VTPYIEPRVEIQEKKDSKLFDNIANRLQLEGYVVLGEKYKKSKDSKSEQSLQKITRIEINENKVEKIRKLLPKVRSLYELVSVNTTSAKAAQWVVKDNRVDILSIPYKSIKEIITQNFANVATNNETFIEIDMSFLLKETEKSPSVTMRTLSRIMNILVREKTPFILSTNVKDPLDFRDERSIYALGQLIGIPPKRTKENMIKFQERIKLNQSKLTTEFVIPGVKKVADKKQVKKKGFQKKTVYLEEIPFHLKDLQIEKMKLERQRYVLFEILQLENTKVELDGLIDLFWKQFTKFYGEVGSSRIGLYLIKYNPEQNIGIIRCNQNSLSALRAMLATITRKEKTKVLFHILKVSGTLKNLLQIQKKKSGN